MSVKSNGALYGDRSVQPIGTSHVGEQLKANPLHNPKIDHGKLVACR